MADPLTPDEERAIASLPASDQAEIRAMSAADRRFLWLPGQVNEVDADGNFVRSADGLPLDERPDFYTPEPEDDGNPGHGVSNPTAYGSAKDTGKPPAV